MESKLEDVRYAEAVKTTEHRTRSKAQRLVMSHIGDDILLLLLNSIGLEIRQQFKKLDGERIK